MAKDRIRICSDWGEVAAELADNEAARALARMLPLTIDMSDLLRQEKTGHLPSPLPDQQRQCDFSSGMLGLWDSDHFVVYYRIGRVLLPGIVVLGRLMGDASIFDRPGRVSVRIERVE